RAGRPPVAVVPWHPGAPGRGGRPLRHAVRGERVRDRRGARPAARGLDARLPVAVRPRALAPAIHDRGARAPGAGRRAHRGRGLPRLRGGLPGDARGDRDRERRRLPGRRGRRAALRALPQCGRWPRGRAGGHCPGRAGRDGVTGSECRLPTEAGTLTALRWTRPGGPRVLALHGWLDNAASFVPIAPHLPGVDLVALDLPGHGRSAHLPPGAEYSLAGTVHAVLDAADALGWDRFAVLGHSMGASIGCLVAAAAPDRVDRLVAIEALGALAEAEDRTAQRLREAVAARRALRGKRLRIFPDPDTAVRARMQASGLPETVARRLVERGLHA